MVTHVITLSSFTDFLLSVLQEGSERGNSCLVISMVEHLGNLSMGTHGITVSADWNHLQLPFSEVLSAAQVSGWWDALCERCQVQRNSWANTFKLCFHFFPGCKDRETLQACSTQDWGQGAGGSSAGGGSQKGGEKFWVWHLLLSQALCWWCTERSSRSRQEETLLFHASQSQKKMCYRWPGRRRQTEWKTT